MAAMETFLSLGSNLGGRMANLRSALIALSTNGLRIKKVSPVVESPALLLDGAKPSWNKPYLNIAVQADTQHDPAELLVVIKQIETELGRDHALQWAPRPIDIDILLFENHTIATETLTVPHRQLQRRPFVLTPLVALNPNLRIPGMGSRSVLQLSRDLGRQIPLWMGIVNVTPDSFSDGGQRQSWSDAEPHINEMVNGGAQYLDIGAESTRPGATPISGEEEWARLAPVLEPLVAKFDNDMLRPRISVDTYHHDVAMRALALGVDVINDVSGLTNPEMIELAASYNAEWIAMHNVSVPANPSLTLPSDQDPVANIERWLVAQLERWTDAGIDLGRIYFDPGIGFGKTSLQSLEILRRIEQFRRHGLRVLVGHSRKSFMMSFVPPNDTNRDLTTLGASLKLVDKGVDVIRVHDVSAHATAYLGWAHLGN
jgi:2-amino-4-hydroxy-6-hydroxymethyldihydropteridine diphosphokinase/dihydropteroate synthase